MTKPDSPAPSKEQLRSLLRSAFSDSNAEERQLQSDSLVQNLTDFLTRAFPTSFRIATFSSLPHEPDLSRLPLRLPEKQFLYPLVLSDSEMSFHLVSDSRTLKKGAFGILEPNPQVHPPVPAEEIDLVLVPALAFDPSGSRLGQGRGYYDRFLSTIPSTPTIGVIFSSMVVPKVPCEPHDHPVNYLATEQEIISF